MCTRRHIGDLLRLRIIIEIEICGDPPTRKYEIPIKLNNAHKNHHSNHSLTWFARVRVGQLFSTIRSI